MSRPVPPIPGPPLGVREGGGLALTRMHHGWHSSVGEPSLRPGNLVQLATGCCLTWLRSSRSGEKGPAPWPALRPQPGPVLPCQQGQQPAGSTVLFEARCTFQPFRPHPPFTGSGGLSCFLCPFLPRTCILGSAKQDQAPKWPQRGLHSLLCIKGGVGTTRQLPSHCPSGLQRDDSCNLLLLPRQPPLLRPKLRGTHPCAHSCLQWILSTLGKAQQG